MHDKIRNPKLFVFNVEKEFNAKEKYNKTQIYVHVRKLLIEKFNAIYYSEYIHVNLECILLFFFA